MSMDNDNVLINSVKSSKKLDFETLLRKSCSLGDSSFWDSHSDHADGINQYQCNVNGRLAVPKGTLAAVWIPSQKAR